MKRRVRPLLYPRLRYSLVLEVMRGFQLGSHTQTIQNQLYRPGQGETRQTLPVPWLSSQRVISC